MIHRNSLDPTKGQGLKSNHHIGYARVAIVIASVVGIIAICAVALVTNLRNGSRSNLSMASVGFASSPVEPESISLQTGQASSTQDKKLTLRLVEVKDPPGLSTYRAVADVKIADGINMTIEGAEGSRFKDRDGRFVIIIREVKKDSAIFLVRPAGSKN